MTTAAGPEGARFFGFGVAWDGFGDGLGVADGVDEGVEVGLTLPRECDSVGSEAVGDPLGSWLATLVGPALVPTSAATTPCPVVMDWQPASGRPSTTSSDTAGFLITVHPFAGSGPVPRLPPNPTRRQPAGMIHRRTGSRQSDKADPLSRTPEATRRLRS